VRSDVLMGGLFQGSTDVQSFNPNPSFMHGAQAAATNQLGGFFAAPAGSGNPFLQMLNLTPQGRAAQQGVSPVTSGLAQQAGGALGEGMSGLQPEQMALQTAASPLAGIMQQGPLSFGNQFNELQNPFAPLAHFNQGQSVIGAAQPIFQQNLQS